MYAKIPSLLLGFHGCDLKVKQSILKGKDRLKASKNDYDWLGNGIYFWENDPDRAKSYAEFIKNHPERCSEKITKPSVIGAIIDPGYCLNLFEEKSIGYLKNSYEILINIFRIAGLALPENKKISDEDDVLLRRLDCAVIETLHTYNKDTGKRNYDSVRSPFWEGKEIYMNSGFKEKNHIQICVRNSNCIKGYFDPLEFDAALPPV